MAQKAGLAVATRFYGKTVADLERLDRWLTAAVEVSSICLVAVDSARDQSGVLDHLVGREGVTAFPVIPWGKFTPALNALALEAANRRADRILFASVEFPPKREIVDKLDEYLAPRFDLDKTLVVGARLSGHEFHKTRTSDEDGQKSRSANGRQIPWNTLDLWNLRKLTRTGFPLVTDSPFDPTQAGVEELVTVALQQTAFGVLENSAHLISIPELEGEWDTAGWDEERLATHERKMATKVTRPASQLKVCGLPHPQVYHWDYCPQTSHSS